MTRSNPLLSLFSACDLTRIEMGKCIVCDAEADRSVSAMLTGSDGGFRRCQERLAQWFVVANEKHCGDYFLHQMKYRLSDRKAFLQAVGELMAGYFIHTHLDSEVEYRFDLAEGGPDMVVHWQASEIQCEVKSVVRGEIVDTGQDPRFNYEPNVQPLREALKGCQGQLKKSDRNLVLIADWCIPVPLTDEDVSEALFGTFYFTAVVGQVDSDGIGRGRDGRCGPRQNRRIGAVGVLRDCDGTFEARFAHNPYAYLPISSDALVPWPQILPDWHKMPLV